MRPRTLLAALALAVPAVAAQATNTTDWGTLGPTAAVAVVAYAGPQAQPIDDIYSFSLGAWSDIRAYADEYEAQSVSMPGATFALYAGTWGDPAATQVGASYAFAGAAAQPTYYDLAAGDYFFRIEGGVGPAGALYDFEAYADNAVPPPEVPEPGGLALLLAGLALTGFLGLRRRR